MDLWIFDNDGTLYDDSRVAPRFLEILSCYTSELADVQVQDVDELLKGLKKKWSTEFSIVALMKEYKVNFLEIVQNTYLKIPLDECGVKKPDEKRLRVLQAIEAKKIVFTNNPSQFAHSILLHTGLVSQNSTMGK